MASGRVRAVAAVVLCMSMIVGALAFCTDSSSAQSEPQVFVVASQQDIPDFNIWNLASNSVWKWNVLGWGLEGLVGLDYDMLPNPLLAESWSFDEPTLTWTFNLRQGVKFHDGSAMTADDVVFIYKAAREGTVYSSEIINAFDGDNDGAVSQAEIDAAVTKVGTYTVQMQMAVPYGLFLTSTASVPILPKAIWQDHLGMYGLVDTLWNDPDACVGTGPFRYLEGADNEYRVIDVFTDYWGRNSTTPLGYRLYPAHIDRVYFRVLTSIDSAVQALQSGTVDYIPWAITAGRVPVLQADPNVKLEFLSDNGYFYLAFNQKLDPMGDISFRKAVSHVIDKDQIVNVYMGGLGEKGSACEPPLWGKDAWHNDTVEEYPFDADFSTPNALLDAAGFVDSNGDGWRDLPDGTPMQKITILTPPADYDNIRIRAGQMIAKNMRDGLHVDAEAKAIDFDTLVSRLQSMDYQMLIIGWSLTPDPVGNVFGILGPRASSNTFGFWSEANPNPYYKDLMGVNTRADVRTQEIADEVDILGILARSSYDISDQVMYTRWAQGSIADAVPVNVLYYRVNVEAYGSSWVGMCQYLGTLLNRFSLALLEETGEPVGLREANAAVNAALSLPDNVGIGSVGDAYVTVIDNSGRPVFDASVSIAASGYGPNPVTVTVNPTTGSTDGNGVFEFDVQGISRGYSNITATVTKGTSMSVALSMILSVGEKQPTLVLGVRPDSLVLLPGESTIVNLNVTDEDGAPVQDATIWIDPYLVGYGSVDDTVVTTDAGGNASLTYTAPSAILERNAHLTVSLAFSVSKPGYLWTDYASVNVVIYNSLAPDWVIAQVDSVSTTAVSRAANLTTIAVSAVDDEGNPLGDHTLGIRYSDESRVFQPLSWIITDGAGAASFDVQMKDSAGSFALRVTVGNFSTLNSVPVTVTLTYAGDGTVPRMYGGYMTWDTHYLDPSVDWIEATAYVWDETGAPADGINASLVVSGTLYGSLVWNDFIYWDSTWDLWGINIVTDEDNANLVTSGPITAYFDYANWELWYNSGYLLWDWADNAMVPVDVVGGSVAIGIYAQDWAPLDLIGQIYLVPEGMAFFNETSLSYQMTGPSTISGDYVIGRAYSVATPSYYIADPVLEARTAAYDETDVTVWTSDESNAPLAGASARVYQNVLRGNIDYTVYPSSSFTTDSEGAGTATIVAVGRGGYVPSASLQADVYVRASNQYAVSMFSQSRVFIQTQQCFVSLDPVQEVKIIGDNVAIGVTVVDFAGMPVVGKVVELTAEAGGVAVPTAITGVDGRVNFLLNTSNITSAPVGYIPVRASTGGPAYDPSSASMMIPIRDGQPPVADAGGDATATEGDMVNFNGFGSTDNFAVVNFTWMFTYDGSPVVLYGDSPSFLFLIAGTYPVTLNVTDRAGNSDTDIVVITVGILIPEFPALFLPVTCLLSVVAVLGLARSRRR